MEYIIIVLSIICMVEAWLLIEAGRELDKTKYEGNEGIESIIELSMERNKLKDENEELREEIHQLYERIAEDMGCEKPVCTCHYEETCAGFPEHNMSKEEMEREMLRQNEEEMKAEEARLAPYVCDQCSKRGGCYCNGMTSSGEVFCPSAHAEKLTKDADTSVKLAFSHPDEDEACIWCGSVQDGCCNWGDILAEEMTKEEFLELKRQRTQKKIEDRRDLYLRTGYACDLCGKKDVCFCTGFDSHGEVLPDGIFITSAYLARVGGTKQRQQFALLMGGDIGQALQMCDICGSDMEICWCKIPF